MKSHLALWRLIYQLGSTDAATRRGRRCPRVRPRPATWIPRGFLRLAPTRADSASTRADASRFGPTRAWIGRNQPVSADIGRYRPVSAGIGRYRPESAGIGRNSRFRPKFKKKKKKKKNPERTVLLNTNPTSAQIHSKRQNTLLTLLIVFYLVLISNLWVVF